MFCLTLGDSGASDSGRDQAKTKTTTKILKQKKSTYTKKQRDERLHKSLQGTFVSRVLNFF